MGLLTLKPLLYAFNVDEADLTLGRQAALEAAEATLRSSTRAERQTAGAASLISRPRSLICRPRSSPSRW